ncbi:acidic amino acid decarboxylase GADL1 isoform X1 [Tribolium madens]|uniref:acidic amino acid decarboxylase GADL1 isoform X1 n=2 Tax=Tribolium madens TaxID=41895 RepID=UPI001CF745B8|nr:acidic amino acid decarboxylase GADL1 isoform X1 [Tribolium madens]
MHTSSFSCWMILAMDTLNVFDFLDRIVKLIKEEHILNPQEANKVIEYVDPQDLKNKIDLSLTDPCANLEELEAVCKDIIKYSIKTNSAKFHNQLYGGTDLYGLGATWLAESLNTNQHTFEVAPVFSIIELKILEEVKKLIGYKEGDGIFSPGGSISNMYGMVLARYKKFPETKTKGLHGLPILVAFTSEEGHYSLQKSAQWLGLGTDNLVKIKTDNFGRMIAEELEKAIISRKAMGHVPFFVNATAGTTVVGAIDPLDKIADICERHNLWLHIDACYGGTLLLSKNYKERLEASHRSDSFAWNPHKMLGAPLQCSIFITRHNNILHECNSASAVYLFQQDKFYDVSYDTGDKSIQCGRKVDGFKLWVMWKARGKSGFEDLVDNAIECANYFKTKISNLEGFRLVQDSFETTAVCFWYIPRKMRDGKEDDEWWKKMNNVAPAIKEKLVKSGKLMIGYSPLVHRGFCNFFRMITTCHPVPTYSDMDYVIEQIKQIGEVM